jgi:uncharacterized membrane protein
MREAYKCENELSDMSPLAVDRKFTRRYIDDPTPDILEKNICNAFDKVAENKDIVLIEGTGHAGRKRSLVKTLSWRTIATTDTILIARIITGSWTVGFGIATIEVFTKMALYYLHERGWSSLDWGLEDVDVDARALELRPVH